MFDPKGITLIAEATALPGREAELRQRSMLSFRRRSPKRASASSACTRIWKFPVIA